MKPQATSQSEQQLEGFIDKFDPDNAALIRSVRKALRKRLYDNYNFLGAPVEELPALAERAPLLAVKRIYVDRLTGGETAAH